MGPKRINICVGGGAIRAHRALWHRGPAEFCWRCGTVIDRGTARSPPAFFCNRIGDTGAVKPAARFPARLDASSYRSMTPYLAHSATKLEQAADRVVICGSHGGRYVGLLAVRAGVRAILVNDAGIGLDRAGIGGLQVCQSAGVPAAALAHTSCRIGNANSASETGVVSHMNAAARAHGVHAGQSAAHAAAALGHAPPAPLVPAALATDEEEHRSQTHFGALRVIVMDSNGLVRPGEDDGAVIITGSHGGLVGDDPQSAGRAEAILFAYNDAGVGRDAAGLSRLPVLDARGVPAVTVGHETARIGDGASTLEHGVVSHANSAAARHGACAGLPLSAFVRSLASM